MKAILNKPENWIFQLKNRYTKKTIYKLNDGTFVVTTGKQILLHCRSEKRAFTAFNTEVN